MSPKQWLALLCFYALYLLFGACVFYYIEHNKEREERAERLLHRIKVNELLVKFASPEDEQIQNKILKRVSDYCGRPVTNHTLDEYPEDYRRTFFHSFWFAFIVCSTLGYGSSSPHDLRAQAFLIFYGLIGLPLNGFVLTYLGDFFAKTFVGIYKRYKGEDHHSRSRLQRFAAVQKFGLISRIMMLLIPGITFFIFLPACLFTYFEDWPYVTSVYYAFITLTTIGFGDYVPTFQDGQARKFGIYFTFYQTFIFIWDVIGTGYFIMIIGFIAKGMQSKRIARIEHQLSMNIKETQHRIWTEVTKDISFLRRVLNEIHLMKFTPVYTDSTEKINYHSLPRSLSCPELTMYRTDQPRIPRKRTNSDNLGQWMDSSAKTSTVTINRVQSEGDLSRIDKKKTFKTFEGSSLFQTQDVLSNILTALGSIQLSMEDSQSKQSLAHSDNSESKRPPQRQRAFSDFYIPQQQNSYDNVNELTWNANNDHKIQEYLKNRPKKFSIASIFASRSESLIPPDATKSTTLQVPGDNGRRISGSFMSKINPFKASKHLRQEAGKRHSVSIVDPQMYLNNSAKGRASLFSLSTKSSSENIELLEKTTIADLIRAVEECQGKLAQTSLLTDFRGSIRAKSNVLPQTPLLTERKNLSVKTPTLQIPSNESRRGSLRPVPTYTTVFSSQNLFQPNKPSPLAGRLPASSTTMNANVFFTPKTSRKNLPTQHSPPSHILRRTFSLRPSPLATSSHSISDSREVPETPIITVQPPDATSENVLWRPESRIVDRSLSELRNRHKRADSK